MGIINNFCWLAVGAGLGYLACSVPSPTDHYRLVERKESVFVEDTFTGRRRELFRGPHGPQLGTIEERVEDVFDTPPHEYDRVIAATRKYGK